MKLYIAALAAGTLLFICVATTTHASTPNTTAAGAVSYEFGSGWITDGVDETAQNRWFAFTELAGRSYCVEATLGPATYFPLDPNVTLYSDSGGTVVYLSNTDGAGEPTQYRGARVCYQSALAVGTSFVRLFKVNVPIVAGSGDSGFVRTRVVDTTLIFPTFCVQNDGGGAPFRTATMSVTNTTTVDINATVYVPGYGSIKTISSTSLKAPNQSTNKGTVYISTITAPSGIVSWSWYGAVYLMNDGPPGALEAWADTPDTHCGPGTTRVYAYTR